jgi:transposase-like protein
LVLHTSLQRTASNGLSLPLLADHYQAVQVFQRDLELTFTFYQFDSTLHRHIRTTNHLEHLFREFRTKSDEIEAFPHETSCLTVFFLVIDRDHAKHDRKSVAENS